MDERDMRDMRGMDGRRLPPRNSRGEFMSRGRGRGRRGDRGMDYADMRGDMRMRDYDIARGGGRGSRGGQGGGRSRDRGDYGDYRGEDMRRGDMRGMQYGYSIPQSGDVRYQDYGMDGHHMGGRQSGYEPVEFMGYCSGYYGSPDHGDYRGGRDYGYDMRGGYGRSDYGYDYGYDDYGDYGETLSEKELEHWNKKLMEQLDERERQMFKKESIMQKAKQMGKQMDGFGENELYTAVLMVYTDYKQSIGQNPDLALKLAYDWLTDKDSEVKGAEKLALYHDLVMGEL